MSLITHLFNLLYPPRCPACGALVARDGDWCPSCLAAVWHPRRINKPAAVRHLAACYCLADYRGAMRHILHDIKYNGKQGKCRACRVLLDRFPWPERFDRIDRVVPVPLAPEKLQRRGFNQAEALFRDWASVRCPAAPAADESPVAALPGRAEGECPRRLCRQRNRPRPGKTHPPRRRHLHDRRDLRSLCPGADKKRRYQRDRTRHRQRRTVK